MTDGDFNKFLQRELQKYARELQSRNPPLDKKERKKLMTQRKVAIKRDRKNNQQRGQKRKRPTERGDLTETENQKRAAHREALGRQHDVIIVPIVWKQRENEKDTIMGAADAVKSALMSRNVNAWIDSRTKYTPGQKFAYWEHIGNKYRVEIGPKEVETKTVILSICEEVGKPCKRLRNFASPDVDDEAKSKEAADLIVATFEKEGMVRKTRKEDDDDDA